MEVRKDDKDGGKTKDYSWNNTRGKIKKRNSKRIKVYLIQVHVYLY